MRFTSLLPAVLIGAASAAPASASEYAAIVKANPERHEFLKRQIPSRPCSHLTGGIHILVLGGANSPDPKANGYLQSLSNAIMAAIPGSSNVSVPYDKVFASMTPPTLEPGAITGGMTNLKQYTVEYHHACPNTKMAVIGYSSGGVITMNDICNGGDGSNGSPQLNPLLAGNTIIGQVVYGEETYVPGQPWNKGTCTSGHGTKPRADPAICSQTGYGANLASYCDSGDTDCCIGQGTQSTAVHFTYPAKYDQAAAQFIKGKYEQYKNVATYKPPN